jgi:hypothetical protein
MLEFEHILYTNVQLPLTAYQRTGQSAGKRIEFNWGGQVDDVIKDMSMGD